MGIITGPTMIGFDRTYQKTSYTPEYVVYCYPMEITKLQLQDALRSFFNSDSRPVTHDDVDIDEKIAFVGDNVLRESDMITLASFLARRIQKSEEQDVHNPLQAALLDLKLALQNLDALRAVSLVKTFALISELMITPGVRMMGRDEEMLEVMEGWTKK